jgi:CRP-like cAMP-binding protein
MINGESKRSCENCPVSWRNFKNLSTSELRLVNDNRYEASFKPGEMIIKQGSPASSAVFLSAGLAKIFMESTDRKQFILEIARPTSMIVSPGVYVNSSNSYSVSALTPVHTCFISLQIINQLINQNAKFASGMVQDLSVKSLIMHNKLVSLSRKKMSGRLAEVLLYFADEVYKSNTYEMVLSRQELGEMTNMAKESVVRILKELESSGILISESSKIQILDMEKLVRISEKG